MQVQTCRMEELFRAMDTRADFEQSWQDGGSRWMKVDSWIVMDRHGCPSGCLSRCLGRVGWQGFGLVDTRNECFGKRNRGGDLS